MDEDVIKIRLDPGVVFGNCLHPTTRDCLKALSLVAEMDPLDYVLDLGTGTGVLAVAAALLGAKRVVAVDLMEGQHFEVLRERDHEMTWYTVLALKEG